jgi:hypothetical protein
MKERHCKTCGQTGHYAKTCGRRATAATAPVDRDVKPENAMHEAAPTTAATREERRAERERRRDAERAVAKQHGDEARRRREESEAKALPWNHVEREGDGNDLTGKHGFVWRHRWRHDVTGAEVVATVPMPPSGNPYDTTDGLVARRRLHSPEAIARHMPTARIEVFEGGKLARVIEPSEIAGDPRPGLPTRDELLLRVASLEAELAALRGAS